MKISELFLNAWKKIINIRLIFMTLICAALLGAPLPAGAAGPALITVGASVPSFTLSALDGKSVTLSEDGKNRPVIVHFWNNGCRSCLKELPALEALYQQYKDQGLIIYAVNVRDTNAVATAFANKMKITLPILLDSAGKTAIQYSVMGLPRTYFIDRRGILKNKLMGEATKEALDKLIKNILQ
jgi:peroxiredoxin